jgi:hypothetical protein
MGTMTRHRTLLVAMTVWRRGVLQLQWQNAALAARIAQTPAAAPIAMDQAGRKLTVSKSKAAGQAGKKRKGK